MNSSRSDELGAGVEAHRPLVLDLGKLSPKKAKALKRGEGPFVDEVEPAIAAAVDEWRQHNGVGEVLPIVVIYQKKPKTLKAGLLKMLPVSAS